MAEGECIFCRIVAGEVPARVVRQDEQTLAFRDINPQAPTHVLVIPKRHIRAVNDLEPADAELVGRLFLAAIASSGYRLVMNNGPDAGQSVDHIHLHVLGGRHLAWPPG